MSFNWNLRYICYRETLFKLQTTSVIGGLLLIASLSSVVIPVDDFKKKR